MAVIEGERTNLRRERLLGDIPGAFAQARYVRVAPMKARRVINLIRGLTATEAMTVLRFAPQAASEPIAKVLASAVANAENNERLDPDSLLVAQAFVDEGPTLKRIRPRAQGRAYRIRKRTSHITVVVESVDPGVSTVKSTSKPQKAKNLSPKRAPKKTAAADIADDSGEQAEQAEPAKPAKKTSRKATAATTETAAKAEKATKAKVTKATKAKATTEKKTDESAKGSAE